MAMASNTEDVALDFGEEEKVQKTIKHPFAVLFQLLFRLLAVVVYLFVGWFHAGFIAGFVVVVFLLSLDFWTVKNVTGRYLVGLRWWNHVDEDGNSLWVFESRKGAARNLITTTESRIFWLSLVVCEVAWIVFFFATLLTLKIKWLIVVCLAVLMNGANMYGFVRCKLGSKAKLSTVASNFLGRQVLDSVIRDAQSKSDHGASS